MSTGNNDIVTFLLGTALGVGAGLYLNSKKGKKMRNKALKKVKEAEKTAEEKVNAAYDNLRTQVNNAAEKVANATDA
jgi:gas vesicle protein